VELTERDFLILRSVFRFKFCLGRHIKVLANFSGSRASDRRLTALTEGGYLSRRKYLYGLPYLYTLPHKGRVLLGANKRTDKIRIDKITHDIYVLDTVIFYHKKHGIPLENIESEKELHIKDGFGARKHQPDFVFADGSQKSAVEIELNPKTKSLLEKNIRDNYLSYDRQIWITNDKKVKDLIQSFIEEYANIELMELGEILAYVRH